MDQIQKSLCDMKNQKPVCLKDRNILRSALADYLPNNKLKQNLILNAFDNDIVQALNRCSDVTFAALNCISQLENDYGITKQSAIWAVETWCYLLDLQEIGAALASINPTGQPSSSNNVPCSPQPGIYEKEIDKGIYYAGLDFPEGKVRLTSLYINQSKEIYYAILEKGSSNNKIITNGFFKTQAWLILKSGQRLEVGAKVKILVAGGAANGHT